MAIKRAAPGGPTTGKRAHPDDIREATAAIAEVLAPVQTEVTATVGRLWQEVSNDRLPAYAMIRYSPAPDCAGLIRSLGDAPLLWLTLELIRSDYWDQGTRGVFDSACTDHAQDLPLIPLSRFLAVEPGPTPPSGHFGFGLGTLRILRHADPTFAAVDVNRLWRRHCRLGFSLADLDMFRRATPADGGGLGATAPAASADRSVLTAPVRRAVAAGYAQTMAPCRDWIAANERGWRRERTGLIDPSGQVHTAEAIRSAVRTIRSGRIRSTPGGGRGRNAVAGTPKRKKSR